MTEPPAGPPEDAQGDEHICTVLVVDDDPLIRNLIMSVCADEGYQSVEAADGLDALELLDRHPISIIVFDLDMPRMDGRAFFQRLQEAGNERPTLIVSAHRAQQTADELGATAALEKPFDVEELCEAIERLCVAGQPGTRQRSPLGAPEL